MNHEEDRDDSVVGVCFDKDPFAQPKPKCSRCMDTGKWLVPTYFGDVTEAPCECGAKEGT